MNCYQHPHTPAVGACSVCGRGLCKPCQVVLEGKRFCKRDAEKQLLREDRAAGLKKRGFELTFASVLAVLDGLSGIVVGFLLTIIGILGPSARTSSLVSNTVAPFLNYFAAVLQFSPTNALFVGILIMSLGSIDVVTGFYLWQRSRAAAILSVCTAVLGIGAVASYLVILALAGVFVFVWVISAIVKIALIGYRWDRLA